MNLRLIASFILSITLAACGATPKPEPTVVYRDRTVPVHQPCKPNLPTKPTFDADEVELDAEPDTKDRIFSLSQTLTADRKQRTAYIGVLEAALAGCAQTGIAASPDK